MLKEKTMKKNDKIKKFKEKYAELKSLASQMKTVVKSLKKNAAKLSRDSEAISAKGELLYDISDDGEIIASFKKLPEQMEDLDRWITIENTLNELIDYL